MATGLFKIALVFVSIMVATMELSDARPNIEPSGVFKNHGWDELRGQLVQPEQVDKKNLDESADFENKKKSRSKRFGFGGGMTHPCHRRYGDVLNVHMSQDFMCGCLRPPCKHPGMNGK